MTHAPLANETIASLQSSIGSSPLEAGLHNDLGIALCEAGQLEQAAQSCRRALAIRPDFSKACSNLGVVAAGLGRLNEAAAALRRALTLDPTRIDIRLNLGIILNRLVGNRSGEALLAARNGDIVEVRRQYENLPFPPRDPEAERYVLKVSTPDILAKINQYCFRGSRDFSKPFRVLVAGCGTGDSAVWLAHQLKDMPAEIIAIDISAASLDVAKARAGRRGLKNIRWIHGSLLDVEELGLGLFDFITCLGVLHHLPDPDLGLRALVSVLAPDGGMAIMLYGAMGRSHIYTTQKLLATLTRGIDHPGDRLAFAKRIIANLPATNDFRQREGLEAIRNTYLADDTNLWDTLLHGQDRAYTVSEVREFLASAGLHLQTFASYSGNAATTSLQYDLDFHIGEPSLRERMKNLSLPEREDAAEMMDGSLSLHTVYVTRRAGVSLDPMAPEAILSPMSMSAREIIEHLAAGTDEISILLRNRSSLAYRPSALTRKFLGAIDGHRSNSAIADLLGIDYASAESEAVKAELRIPAALHWVTARTAQGSYLPPLPDHSRLSLSLIHAEPSLLPL